MLQDSIRRIPPAPFKPQPKNWSDSDVTIAWLGHATVLINFFGITILTDPVLGRRVGIGAGPFVIGPKRLVQPALKIKELPRIDLVLLSHAHMDHLDLWTLRRLNSDATVVTSLNSADLLPKATFNAVHELDWQNSLPLFEPQGGLRIEAFRTSHWGARKRSDSHRGWNGYIIERQGRRILFGGDTGFTPHFGTLRDKGPFEIAIMPIGAYNPWLRNHCTPEEALAMSDAAGAKFIVPIHHQTFRLSFEPQHEPIERLLKALAHSPERLALRQIGETFILPAN